MSKGPDFPLSDFPMKSREKIRWGDVDQLGHVNNIAFAVYLENARTDIYLSEPDLMEENAAAVLMHLSLDYKSEILWPGTVDIGTAVADVGRSSYSLIQAIHARGVCCATARSTMVLMDTRTRRARPLSEKSLGCLKKLMAPESMLSLLKGEK